MNVCVCVCVCVCVEVHVMCVSLLCVTCLQYLCDVYVHIA